MLNFLDILYLLLSTTDMYFLIVLLQPQKAKLMGNLINNFAREIIGFNSASLGNFN